MLTALQYLAMITAFFLPWSVGLTIKFKRENNPRALKLSLILMAVCIAVVSGTVALAFSLHS